MLMMPTLMNVDEEVRELINYRSANSKQGANQKSRSHELRLRTIWIHSDIRQHQTAKVRTSDLILDQQQIRNKSQNSNHLESV